MGKIIQIEVPEGLEKEFIEALKEIVDATREILLFKILERSELKEEDAEMLSKEIKAGIAKRHEDSR
ncbi:MAG TPA: hypothetical protein ENG50_01625 [Candidatus Altiarchaeales archaeon]|nr:hypothetical protein [Candidatus Altiarchaeales archaeon]